MQIELNQWFVYVYLYKRSWWDVDDNDDDENEWDSLFECWLKLDYRNSITATTTESIVETGATIYQIEEHNGNWLRNDVDNNFFA